uniref:Uncharacterized protein n=1 Tax=Candidatus Kentrum sp. SD TaxID=2126332 RepID=A0A450YBS8_9GAMM|nr:MAG: hypothetical protein BECKSD772F_GA0070984_103021 [Candidatus Kentron sp. SD]
MTHSRILRRVVEIRIFYHLSNDINIGERGMVTEITRSRTDRIYRESRIH